MRTVLIRGVAVPACEDERCTKPRFHSRDHNYKPVIPSQESQEQANRRSDDPQVTPELRTALSACRYCLRRAAEVKGLCKPCYCRAWRKNQSRDSAYGRRARDRERWAADRARRLSA